MVVVVSQRVTTIQSLSLALPSTPPLASSLFVTMKVFFDLIGEVEVASDGKLIKKVKNSEGKSVEGLVCCECKTIPDPNDEDEDNAMRKLDHLWFFEDINGDEPAEYKKFKNWQKDFFASYVKGLQTVKKENGDFKEDGAKKAFQKRMNGIMNWVKEEFANITFYSLYKASGEVKIGGETKNFLTTQLFCWYAPGATEPVMCWMEDAVRAEKF